MSAIQPMLNLFTGPSGILESFPAGNTWPANQDLGYYTRSANTFINVNFTPRRLTMPLNGHWCNVAFPSALSSNKSISWNGQSETDGNPLTTLRFESNNGVIFERQDEGPSAGSAGDILLVAGTTWIRWTASLSESWDDPWQIWNILLK